MEVDNGIPPEMVDRELAYAYAVTELLYKTNRLGFSAVKRSMFERAASFAWQLGLAPMAKRVLRLIGLEQTVKKMLKDLM